MANSYESLVKSDDPNFIQWTADATYYGGEIIQLRDGRAGQVTVGCVSGDIVKVRVAGHAWNVAKTTSMVILVGTRLFWDHSANKVHLLHRNDRDFYIGTCVGGTTIGSDAASAGTVCIVDLNAVPKYSCSLGQGFVSAPVETAGFVGYGGSGAEGVNLRFSATAEAQKVDALSHYGMAPAAIAIVDALICVNTNGDDAAFDLNVGLANATHATDADSIVESLFIHVDGNNTNIYAESDDNTTEVAATDTTVDFTAGTPFLAQWDLRDLSDIQLYIDGVSVLGSSTFKLNAATGPLKCLAHMEKASNDSPGNVTVLYLGARGAQV